MAWLGAVVGGVQLAGSAIAKNNTEAIAKELGNTRPKIAKDVTQDQNLALVKSDLANGFSAETERAYNDIADRELSTSLSAILKGGGDVNSVGALYGEALQGDQKISMMRDSMRLNQIRNLMEQSQITDSRNTITPFQVNEDAPWKDKAQANAQARAQAAKEQNDAFNTITSSFMQQGQNQTELKKYELQAGKKWKDL